MRGMLGLLSIMFVLAGCAHVQTVKYHPEDFINPNRIVTKTKAVKLPQPNIEATYGLGDDPAIVKAYQQFVKTGVAQNITAKGFRTLAYSAATHPIVACAPLHLCVIQLERNETINNIDIGDSAHWLVTTSRIGTTANGSMEVIIKPKAYDMATDLIITTDKRTYNIGLVSTKGQATHVVSFYYPEETLHHAVALAAFHQETTTASQTIDTETQLDINHIHFNYTLSGDRPAWIPVRVFDDGVKTFIQMPPISSRLDLPVLYLRKGREYTLVNYRYKQPYYIIDGLFQTAYLVSGKGRNQVHVEIDNRNVG